MRKRCTVKWKKTKDVWTAILFDSSGHSINYASGWKRKPAASTRRRVSARLQRSCRELSRP